MLKAQENVEASNTVNRFWKNVQFGGGLGLGISNGFTDISLATSAIYNFNESFAAGAGLYFSYTNSRNNFTTFTYGISTIILSNPLPEIQFSLELNQSRVNYLDCIVSDFSNNFWNTSLIVGAGYRSGNVTFGFGYNLLNNDRSLTNALVPFVRAYF